MYLVLLLQPVPCLFHAVVEAPHGPTPLDATSLESNYGITQYILQHISYETKLVGSEGTKVRLPTSWQRRVKAARRRTLQFKARG
jgi:hypothetical protein